MPEEESEEAPSLDVEHVAELANLPLDEAETADLEQACGEVLATFQLEEADAELEPEDTVLTFPDEAEPWPDEGIEAILAAFPDRDGRSLRP